MKNKKVLKEENIGKSIKKMVLDFKKIFSNVFIIVGLYYLLVSAKIINTKIIWLTDYPQTEQTVLVVAIILLIVGLILNEKIIRRLKNVF